MKINLCKTLFTAAFLFTVAFSYAQNTGVGTSSPDSKLHILSTSIDSVALKVSVDYSTKFKVASNGGTSVGSAATPPANGLLVQGKIDPQDTIKSTTKPIVITSVSDSVVLQAGTTTIVLSANGAVRIKANGPGGIPIDGAGGPVNITGVNVNIKAQNSLTLNSTTTTLQGSALTNIYSPLTRIGSSAGSFVPAARQGDQMFGSASGSVVTGTVTTGSSSVMIQ